MGGKHLKKLRAEKAKVHLKKKKLLPKGQNITDTTFKAKKIVLVEQLKKAHENEPVSSWNLTLKDLIVRLNHYNYMARLNSLNGIKELISNYKEILEGPSLRIIITRILELLIDIEHKVRVTAISLLSDIFNRLPSHCLVPFYDLLNVYIGCAMTHREPSIQRDSLKLIDAMVQFTPRAIEKNFSVLVQNFIRILPSFKYGSHLEVNFLIKSKKDMEKFKTDLLKRFYQLLNVVYSESKTHNDGEENFLEISSKNCVFNLRALNNFYKKSSDLSTLFKANQTLDNPIFSGQDCINEFKSQISAIVPLLFDIWNEFAPNSSSDNFQPECLLTENIAQLLLIILQILLLLLEKIASLEDDKKTSWFASTFKTLFLKSLMAHFPYMPRIEIEKPGQSSNSIDQTLSSKHSKAYLTQNLILCYFWRTFKVGLEHDEIDVKVDDYVLNALRIKNPSDFKILVKIVEVMIKESTPRRLEKLTAILVKVHDSTSNLDYRRRLFTVLTKIAVENESTGVRQTNYFKNWMKTLPQMLLKPHVPLYVVETLLRLINQKAGEDILKDLEENASRIVSELPNIRVNGKNEFEGQKLIVHLLYRCRKEVLEKILSEEVLTKDPYSQKVRDYILEIISLKLGKT